MSTYCVAVRIAAKTLAGKTYDERRQTVIDAIYSKHGYWDELTSFFLVTSSVSTSEFARSAATGLNRSEDLLLVFDPEDMSAAYFGNFAHVEAIGSFFNSLEKV